MSEKTIVEVHGYGVAVDAEAVARRFLGFCQNPDCDGKIGVPIGINPSRLVCDKCGEEQPTATQIIEDACEKLPFISL